MRVYYYCCLIPGGKYLAIRFRADQFEEAADVNAGWQKQHPEYTTPMRLCTHFTLINMRCEMLKELLETA